MLMPSFVIAVLLGLVNSAPLELCEVSKVWGEASYLDPNMRECNTRDLKLNATSFTMSGFSHGGFMTANLFTMFNDNIDGVGINAGHGPCATAALNCSNPELGPQNVKQYSTNGIEGKPVHIYSGVNDTTVKNSQSIETADLFKKFGADVKELYIHDFIHVMPNSVQSNEQFNPPYSCAEAYENSSGSQQCGFNMAFEIFKHLYGGDLGKDYNYQDTGKLYAVDISSSNTKEALFSDYHFLYVPNHCFNNSCRFHVDFHGCGESNVLWNDTFVRQVGYMEHAAANNIIMLFPSSDDEELYWCWRSSQVEDSEHPQIVAISNLIESIFDRDLLHEGVERSAQKQKLASANQAINLSAMFNQLGNPFGNPLFTYSNHIAEHIKMRKSQQDVEAPKIDEQQTAESDNFLVV